MRLSGSNYGMPTLSLEQALAFHAELGLPAMELTVLPGYSTALERLEGAPALFRRFDLACSGVANFQTLTDTDAEVTGTVMARHRTAIDLAVDLAQDDRTPVVVFFSGGGVGDWPDARERLVHRIGELAEYARSRGVTMVMKAHALGCVSRPHQLVDLFEQVGSPAFRFCFDMSHFEVQGLSIEQAMYPLLALSKHTEVKASIGRAPNQEYMIPGESNTQSDFEGQFQAMRRLGYAGYLVPEMSVHVMRRPNYDQYAALRLAATELGKLLEDV
ncbi:MAG: sugar phosphate isomerase/epimerase family protein [Chloroflexota bacterium]